MNTIIVDAAPTTSVTPSGMPGVEFSLNLEGEAGGMAPEWPGAALGLSPDAVFIGAPFQRAVFLPPLSPVDASSLLAADPSTTVVSS